MFIHIHFFKCIYNGLCQAAISLQWNFLSLTLNRKAFSHTAFLWFSQHSNIKDAQISAGCCCCCRGPLRIYHKLGLIFHMQKGLRWTPYNSVERRWSARLYISPPSPLNYLLKLLKWPEMQTYKLLITGTMIAYYSIGMPELCINDDSFIFFWGLSPACWVEGLIHWNRFWLLESWQPQLYWALRETKQGITG